MKNPITLHLKNGQEFTCGDPFILRFNGKYYLYPSGTGNENGVRLFISDDLCHFEEYGYVVENPLLRSAYAPEVIYHDGYFYMCTSPGGNGHYFLKSEQLTGPFEIISDNLASMIDGSFVHDENFNLKFVRADHNGIVMLDFDPENIRLTNRRYLLPQISRGWTEGPTVFYRYPYYYATYCGNFLISTSYRVKYGSSKFIDQGYHIEDEPLIISTKKGYSALGHNSVVLGPNLDQYYVAYHILQPRNEGFFRYLGLDAIHFNGTKMAVNPSNLSLDKPHRPNVEAHLNLDRTGFTKEKEYILSNRKTADIFTAEFNFKGDTCIVLKHEPNYFTFIDLADGMITIKNSDDFTLFNKKVNVDFNNFHTLRIVNGDQLLIYLDNVYIGKLNHLKHCNIGYVDKEDLYYTAFSNCANGSSGKLLSIKVPGNILINDFDNHKVDGGVYYSSLSQPLSFKLKAPKKQKYYLYCNCRVEKESELLVQLNNETKTIKIERQDSEYSFTNRYLCSMIIDKKDVLTVSLIKGEIDIKEFIAKELVDDYSLIKPITDIKNKKYYFSMPSLKASIDFMFKRFNDDSLFGLIINASNYSTHPSNHHPRFMGYLVGLRNDLLVVEHCQYETTRIYDRPVNVRINQKYNLKVVLKDNILEVYLDNQKMITTILNYQDTLGLSGIYNCRDVILSNYKQEDFYE